MGNEHRHQYNETHQHLHDQQHEHESEHLYVEEHDHSHEHSHVHSHKHHHQAISNQSHLHDHEAAHKHEHQHETVRYADHNEYHDQRRRMSERNDELHVPGHLNINYQHLPALIELFNSQSSRPSSKFRLGDDLEIFTAANEYLKQRYHQLQNANEKRKEPKKAISNNYENHVILQYRDNQYPQQQFESPPYKKAEKKKYLSQIEPMSPNKYRNRNRATNQSKDHENHDSHEYLSHLQKY